jgi:hypothetical protein
MTGAAATLPIAPNGTALRSAVVGLLTSPSPRPAPDADDRPARGTPDGGRAAPSSAPSPEAADPSTATRPEPAAGTDPAPAASVTAGEAPPAARRSPPASDRGPGLVDAISKLVMPVVQRTAFRLILLIVAGLFLLVQDRIDRRDPKLAHAPLHARPDLPFPGPTVPGWRSFVSLVRPQQHDLIPLAGPDPLHADVPIDAAARCWP